VRSDFEETYKQLGIPPLPLAVERQEQIQRRLAQLSREACYTDAIVGLGRALLDAGYPREAAISSRSFVKRCGTAPEVLPLAYTSLQKLNDYSGALEVADELVNALPASATVRYWRALAYDHTGKVAEAMFDYMNTVQLTSDPKTVFGDVFYKWSRTYAALHRYCDAISPIEMYIALDPVNRRTPQMTKIISDYAEQGACDKRHATGTARVPFAVRSGVRTLNVVVNNVGGAPDFVEVGEGANSLMPRPPFRRGWVPGLHRTQFKIPRKIQIRFPHSSFPVPKTYSDPMTRGKMVIKRHSEKSLIYAVK
jgi:hypothetical protein